MYVDNIDEFYNQYTNNIKEPFQFISVLIAIWNIALAIENNESIVINNPILFDASCSGIQHLSAMTRDVEIARKVNILSEEALDNADEDTILDKSRGQDFYEYSAKNIQTQLDNLDNDKLNKIVLNRKMIKKTVMTIPYYITIHGVNDQLREFFIVTKLDDKYFYQVNSVNTKNNQLVYLLPSEFNLLVNIVYKTLIRIPSLSKLTKYLNSILTILLKLDQPIIWLTPSKLPTPPFG